MIFTIEYNILFLFLIFLNQIKRKEKKNNQLLFFLAIITLIIMFGLAYDVGTDYFNYEIIFKKTNQLNSFFILDSGWGLNVIFYIFKKIGLNFYTFIFCMITFNMTLLYKSYKKIYFSNLYLLSLLTYFCFFLINVNLNAMKQGIAISLFLYSLIFVYKKDLKMYLFLNLIGMLFHSLALIVIPFYWILQNKLKVKDILKYFIILLLIILILKNNFIRIGNLFINNPRYYQYFTEEFKASFNIINAIEVYLPFGLLIYIDNKYKLRSRDRRQRIIINGYYGYSFIYLLCIIDKVIGFRFSLFLSPFLAMGYPYIFKLLSKNIKQKKIVYLLYCLFIYSFLILRYMLNSSTNNYKNILIELLK